MVDEKILIAVMAIAVVVAAVAIVAIGSSDNDDEGTDASGSRLVSEMEISDGMKTASNDVSSKALCRVDSGDEFTIILGMDISGRNATLSICDTTSFSDQARTTYADSWIFGVDGRISESDLVESDGSKTLILDSEVLSEYNDGKHLIRLTVDDRIFMFSIAKPYSIDVWFDDGLGNTVKYTGSGTTIRTAVLGSIGDHDILFAANGNVSSVDGKERSSEGRWVVFRWASPGGWSTVSKTDAECHEGMTLALRYSKIVRDDAGNTTYEAPDIDVKYKVYYFVQIREELNSTDWLRGIGISDDMKKEGFWISGEGSTNNEALADAMIKAFYPHSEVEIRNGANDEGNFIEYVIDGKEGFFKYGTKADMYGWFLSFMGWSDKKVGSGGEYGTWTYWNQYSYNPDAKTDDDPVFWDFNQWSFGLYDISEYRYFGLVLKTSQVEDTFIDIPTPSDIPAGL